MSGEYDTKEGAIQALLMGKRLRALGWNYGDYVYYCSDSGNFKNNNNFIVPWGDIITWAKLGFYEYKPHYRLNKHSSISKRDGKYFIQTTYDTSMSVPISSVFVEEYYEDE